VNALSVGGCSSQSHRINCVVRRTKEGRSLCSIERQMDAPNDYSNKYELLAVENGSDRTKFKLIVERENNYFQVLVFVFVVLG
jgi:hypothetical protein